MKLVTILAASAAALFSTVPASAARIVYTYSSTFTGTRDGNPFVTDATFTGVGDTTVSTTPFGFSLTPLTSFVAQADGPYVITTPFAVGAGAAPFPAAFGFVADVATGNAFAFLAPGLLGYDGRSSIGATSTLPLFTNATFTTDRGNIVLTGQSVGTFSAVVDAVPETATWGMMIGGLGLIGGALRRRTMRPAIRHA